MEVAGQIALPIALDPVAQDRIVHPSADVDRIDLDVAVAAQGCRHGRGGDVEQHGLGLPKFQNFSLEHQKAEGEAPSAASRGVHPPTPGLCRDNIPTGWRNMGPMNGAFWIHPQVGEIKEGMTEMIAAVKENTANQTLTAKKK